jgi:hypothetical protein
MSALIDYRDNVSYGDPGISIYNFLTFSDAEWARWNPRLSYQNRLRHSDYFKLFRCCRLQNPGGLLESGRSRSCGLPRKAPIGGEVSFLCIKRLGCGARMVRRHAALVRSGNLLSVILIAFETEAISALSYPGR